MTAIVTDTHYRMSVSLIRDLFDRGVRVVACEKASIEAPVGFASRGTAQCVRLPDKEYEAALLALCREVLEIEGEKPVLLPVGAKTLAMVSRSRDAFSAVAGLCAATPSQLALFNDKAAVSALAKTLGVPVPESFERQPEEADEPFFSRVPLPCAVKPHCGENFGLTASQRYRICRTKDELRAAFHHFKALTNEDPIVQEYLPGAAYGCSVLAKDGAVYRSLCHRRVREYPVSGGPSSCCESVSRSDLLAFSVFENFAGNFSALYNWGAYYQTVFFANSDYVKFNVLFCLSIELLNINYIAYGYAILFAAGFDDCVHNKFLFLFKLAILRGGDLLSGAHLQSP